MGRVFSQFEVGQRFVTPGRTIAEADIVAFAGLTGDYNPVHTDEEFARATDFGGRIAHGPMGIGIAFGLASRLDLIDGTVVALLGVTWDFRAPTRAGDTVRAVIDVAATRAVKNPEHGLVELAIQLVNQHATAVQSGSARLLMRRSRPAAASWGLASGAAGATTSAHDG
jgi:acyl dehydratase